MGLQLFRASDVKELVEAVFVGSVGISSRLWVWGVGLRFRGLKRDVAHWVIWLQPNRLMLAAWGWRSRDHKRGRFKLKMSLWETLDDASAVRISQTPCLLCKISPKSIL